MVTRIDPIYGTTKFHAGMDFSAHPGTDVYATGDGTVVKMGWEAGYGNLIIVDHGFGYQSGMPTCRDSVPNSANGWCGARLSVRLEVPAKVQGPHLHYEVHVKRAGRKSRELLLYGFKCRRLRPYDTDCGKSWKNDGLADYEMFN